MKILIADDSALSRELLLATLRKQGHYVIPAANGQDAWDIFRRHDGIQALITDWIMPGLDGLELCRQVRSLPQSHYIYIILLTNLKGKQHYLQGLDAGADDFMSKPLDPTLLQARLQVVQRIFGLRYEVEQLRTLLPICSYCKNIRTEGSWTSVENFINGQIGADFTHSICPRCYENVVQPELQQLKKKAAPPKKTAIISAEKTPKHPHPTPPTDAPVHMILPWDHGRRDRIVQGCPRQIHYPKGGSSTFSKVLFLFNLPTTYL